MQTAKGEFEALGAQMELVPNPRGKEFFPDGTEVDYPPILLGTYPAVPNPNKKTILLYGH